jgi:BCD family chlorophyll transporter-like MFS transporter
LAASPTPGNVTLAFLFFLLEGISTYTAGTAYLALIADLTTSEERGQATGLIWTLLMVGIIVTGVSTSFALREYSFRALVLVFSAGAVLALLMTALALLGQERRVSGEQVVARGGLGDALRLVVGNRSARAFAGFLLASMFSYFMQDVLLEPFGGEVFGLSAAETTRFNAYMGVGVISSMLFGGMWWIPRRGKRPVTAFGVWVMVITFLALAGSSLLHWPQGLPLVIGLLGAGAGFFTVGGVALMMDMTAGEHTGLFVGAWTLVQALARGPASLVGGGLHALVSGWGATTGEAYAAVFSFEALGLVLSAFLLRRVAVEGFQQEVRSLGELTTEALDA